VAAKVAEEVAAESSDVSSSSEDEDLPDTRKPMVNSDLARFFEPMSVGLTKNFPKNVTRTYFFWFSYPLLYELPNLIMEN